MNLYAHIIGSMFLVVPLIFSVRSSELFEFPKMLTVYFYALCLIPPTLYYMYHYARQKIPMPRRTLILVASLGLFILSQSVSSVLSIDRHVSIFGYYSRFNGGLLSLLSYSGLGFGAFILLTRKDIQTVLRWSFVGGVFTALWALPSRFGYDFICLLTTKQINSACWTNSFDPTQRLFGTLGQPNWFAAYLLIQLSIALYFLIADGMLLKKLPSQISTLLLTASAILFSTELIWTRSRSAYIAFGAIGAMWLLYSLKLQKKRVAIAAVLLCMVLLSIGPTLRNEFEFVPVTARQVAQEKVQKKSDVLITPSSVIRLIVWKGATDLVRHHPIFGTGVETFAYAYYFARPISHNSTSEWNYIYNKAHNELLNYAANSGLVGLSTYVFFFSTIVILAVLTLRQQSHYKHMGMFAISVLSAIFITNFFGFSTTTTNIFFYTLPFWLLLIVKPQFKIPPQPPRWLFVGFLAGIMLGSVYIANYFNADKYYALSQQYSAQEDISNAYGMIEKALSLRKEPNYLNEETYLAAQLALYSSANADIKMAQIFAETAQNSRNEILQTSPFNVTYWRTAGKSDYLLSLVFAHDKKKSASLLESAFKDFETAQHIAPSDPRNFYAEAILQVESNPKKAIKLLKKTLQLKKDYPEAEKYLQQLEKSV